MRGRSALVGAKSSNWYQPPALFGCDNEELVDRAATHGSVSENCFRYDGDKIVDPYAWAGVV